ncbi:hypothetical protein [Chlorogloeopsis sp. ULAP02]
MKFPAHADDIIIKTAFAMISKFAIAQRLCRRIAPVDSFQWVELNTTWR